jgi:NAD(P)H dehydrogenase (quinone)
MYLISGITGHTGAAVAATLLAANKKLRATVRDPAKAAAWKAKGVEIVIADVGDAAALEKAFAGVEGAYVLIPPGPASIDPVGSYLAAATATRAAARAAKLPRLVQLSSVGAQHPRGNGPIRGSHVAEAVLADAAKEVTFLRAASFQENWVHVWGLAAAQGILPTFLKDLDAKTEMVAAADIGRVAAELLMADKPAQIVELAGPLPASVRDAAGAMSGVLGKPVQPVQPPREQWVGMFTGNGMSPAFAELMAEMYDGWNSGHVQFSGTAPVTRGRVTLAETFASWPKPKMG